MKDKIKEVARIAIKYKSSPDLVKSTIVLLSNGTSWFRRTTKDSSGKKIQCSWELLTTLPNVTSWGNESYIKTFLSSGWKNKKPHKHSTIPAHA